MKVLIAEDEALFRKILSQSLSPEFDLTVTEDGTTALAGLQQDGPVLAIPDWVMHGIAWHRRMPGTTSPPANCRHLRDSAHATKPRC